MKAAEKFSNLNYKNGEMLKMKSKVDTAIDDLTKDPRLITKLMNDPKRFGRLYDLSKDELLEVILQIQLMGIINGSKSDLTLHIPKDALDDY